MFVETDGFGHHELIVDTPYHERRMAQMTTTQVTQVLNAYHARHTSLGDDPRIAHVIVFKNSGLRAGASLSHPHSQLVAISMVPPGLERRYALARSHYERTGRSLHRDIIDAERKVRLRVVHETPGFLVFCPFASGVPFETWIAPKQHQSSFRVTSSAERVELAGLLRATLGALDGALGSPDFNYVLHTAPTGARDEGCHCWYLQILPRIATLAGFELGSEIPINAVLPEDAATRLRRVASSWSALRGGHS